MAEREFFRKEDKANLAFSDISLKKCRKNHEESAETRQRIRNFATIYSTQPHTELMQHITLPATVCRENTLAYIHDIPLRCVLYTIGTPSAQVMPNHHNNVNPITLQIDMIASLKSVD